MMMCLDMRLRSSIGRAFDSRSKGCVFKSRRGHFSFLFFFIFLSSQARVQMLPIHQFLVYVLVFQFQIFIFNHFEN